MLRDLGEDVCEVRVPGQLDGLDGLVLPGGESTTMTLGIAREGLAGPLRAFAASGAPLLGTCAGMVLLDREHLGIGDWRCRRNAFGRQVRSFEAQLDVAGVGHDVRAMFIRAPWAEDTGPGVEVLAAVDGHAVAVRQGTVTAVAFHPELTAEPRVHAAFLQDVRQARAVSRRSSVRRPA
jgi:5'-phosphate synthase pdxT subunit